MARPGTTASREVVLSFANKRKNQRKLPLFRRSGTRETWGRATPRKSPAKRKSARARGANDRKRSITVSLLNAPALFLHLKFGSSPEPPQFLTAAMISGDGPQKGFPSKGSWPRLARPEGIPTGCVLPPVFGQPPAHCEGAGCRPPLPLPFATRSAFVPSANLPPNGRTLPACFAATSPERGGFSRGLRPRKRLLTQWGELAAGLALYLVRPHLPQTSRPLRGSPAASFRSAALPPQLPQNPP